MKWNSYKKYNEEARYCHVRLILWKISIVYDPINKIENDIYSSRMVIIKIHCKWEKGINQINSGRFNHYNYGNDSIN